MNTKLVLTALIASLSFAALMPACSSSRKSADTSTPATAPAAPAAVAQNDSLDLGASSAGRAH